MLTLSTVAGSSSAKSRNCRDLLGSVSRLLLVDDAAHLRLRALNQRCLTCHRQCLRYGAYCQREVDVDQRADVHRYLRPYNRLEALEFRLNRVDGRRQLSDLITAELVRHGRPYSTGRQACNGDRHAWNRCSRLVRHGPTDIPCFDLRQRRKRWHEEDEPAGGNDDQDAIRRPPSGERHARSPSNLERL